MQPRLSESEPSRSRSIVKSLLASLFLIGIAGRLLLFVNAPSFAGYYFDQCWPPFQIIIAEHRLPLPEECWQCYQPPLFYLVSAASVATSNSFGIRAELSLWSPMLINLFLSFGIVALIFVTLDRFVDRRSTHFWIGLALASLVPKLFINSAALNLDVPVNLLLGISMVSLILGLDRGRFGWMMAVCGLSAGLAMATKYTGLIAVVVLSIMVLVEATRGRSLRNQRVGALLASLAIALLLGSGVYLRNWVVVGHAMPGNESNAASFGLEATSHQRVRPDFFEFKLGELVRYPFQESAVPALNRQAVYRSPLTGFFGMFWSDLGFFSKEGVSPHHFFPPKRLPPLLTSAIFILGVPAIAIAGFGMLAGRSSAMLPLHLYTLVQLVLAAAYRFGGGPWFLKFSYSLMLVIPFGLYLALGCAAIQRRFPKLGRAAIWTLASQAMLCCAYNLIFAAT